ncbi:MAG: AmmeMemoRadiSam system radical SAM enzyme [Candidatus Hydrothermarchaeales archaeon]
MIEACCYDTYDKTVKCELCVINCEIKDGKKGFCKVRQNLGGKLYNSIYGELSSFSTDFIEKAPCYHFYPNHKFLTIGSIGCNLRCGFCLTWNISQVDPGDVKAESIEIEKLIRSAKELKCRGIVYTHSEPTLNIEYYVELMKEARRNNLANVFATNGYISLKAFDLISEYLDAVALTVKGNGDFYNEVCGVKFEKTHLTRLVDAVKARGIHLEVVYVLIPGYNDDEGSLIELINFVRNAEAPLIFLRFVPSYKMDKLDSPSEESMEYALNLAYEKGLKYAYLENIHTHPGKNTYCEKCKKLLIKRVGYGIVEWNLEDGKCSFCGANIPIVGKSFPLLKRAS